MRHKLRLSKVPTGSVNPLVLLHAEVPPVFHVPWDAESFRHFQRDAGHQDAPCFQLRIRSMNQCPSLPRRSPIRGRSDVKAAQCPKFAAATGRILQPHWQPHQARARSAPMTIPCNRAGDASYPSSQQIPAPRVERSLKKRARKGVNSYRPNACNVNQGEVFRR